MNKRRMTQNRYQRQISNTMLRIRFWAVFWGLLLIAVNGLSATCTVQHVSEGAYLFDTPGRMVLTPGENWLLVLDEMASGVKVIDTPTNQVAAVVNLPIEMPGYLALSDTGETLYVSDVFTGDIVPVLISAQDPNTWEAGTAWPAKGGPMVFRNGHNQIITAGITNDAIQILSAADGTEAVSPLSDPDGRCTLVSDMVLVGDQLFVSCETGNVVSVYDLSTMAHVKNIGVENGPVDLISNAEGTLLIVANLKSDSLSVIDINSLSVTKTIKNTNILTSPIAMTFLEDSIWIIDLSNAVAAKLNLAVQDLEAGTCTGMGPRPAHVAATQAGTVYVAHQNGVDYFTVAGVLSLAVKKEGAETFTKVVDLTLTPGETFDLQITGGSGPFTLSGSGGLTFTDDGDGRLFHIVAPTLEGQQSLFVEDGTTGEIITLFMRIGGTLQVSPQAIPDMEIGGQSEVLTASGGFPPYAWIAQTGFLSATSGRYVVYTPRVTGTDTVTLKDSANNLVTVSIQVTVSGVRISPAVVVLKPEEERTFTALGGSEYEWDAPIGGKLSARSGEEITFTAPTETGEYRLILMDKNTTESAQALIHVVSKSLEISPVETVMDRGGNGVFSVVGGKGPYLWTVKQGELTATKGELVTYIAPTVSGRTEITVRDAGGNEAVARVEVGKDLRISPIAPVMEKNATQTFALSGASGKVTWQVTDGKILEESATRATWEAPGYSDRFYVLATDERGLTAQAVATVVSSEITITPDTAQATQSQAITLRVSGGNGPYLWSAEMGTLSSTEGGLVFWTAPEWLPDGPVYVRAEDTAGLIAQSEVTVQPRQTDAPVLNVDSLMKVYGPGDDFIMRFRGTGPGDWDLYIPLIIPGGQLFCFTQIGAMTLEIMKWTGEDILSGKWQAIFQVALPSPQTGLPQGEYTLYGLLVPQGKDVFKALTEGTIIMDSYTFNVD